MKLESFVQGQWRTGSDGIEIRGAVSGDVVATADVGGLDMRAVLQYGRDTGGANLRKLTFHQRADLLKKLGQYLSERKDELYKLSLLAGCTRTDALIDIDGGIGTLFGLCRQGPPRTAERDIPARRRRRAAVEGRQLRRPHIVTPLHGVAVHINAFNFPCWGMLEKLAPALLAGVPVVTKPATVTAYLAARAGADDRRTPACCPTARCNSSSARPAICSSI